MILAVALIVVIAFHVTRALDPVRDEFEGALLVATQRLTQSMPGPHWFNQLPYTLTPYGPGFFTASALADRVVQGPTPLAAGRLVSVFAGVLTAALIAGVVIQRTRSAPLALACACIYLVFPGVAFWLHDYRVDALATLLAFSAYVAAGVERRGAVWAAVFVVAGSTVKQTACLAAVPVVLHFVLNRDWRSARIHVAWVIALGILVWGGLIMLSDGYVWKFGVAGNRREYFVAQVAATTVPFVTNPFTLLAAFVLVISMIVAPTRLVECRFVTAWVTSTLVATALSGASGAASNYFLEPAALTATVLGLYGAPLLRRFPRVGALALGVFGIALTAAVAAHGISKLHSDARPIDLSELHATLAGRRVVLADPAYIAAAVNAGLVPAVNDPFFYVVAVRNGVVDPGQLSADLRDGRVGGLILHRPLSSNPTGPGDWPDEVASMMHGHFRPAGRAGTGHLYVHQDVIGAGR